MTTGVNFLPEWVSKKLHARCVLPISPPSSLWEQRHLVLPLRMPLLHPTVCFLIHIGGVFFGRKTMFTMVHKNRL